MARRSRETGGDAAVGDDAEGAADTNEDLADLVAAVRGATKRKTISAAPSPALIGLGAETEPPAVGTPRLAASGFAYCL